MSVADKITMVLPVSSVAARRNRLGQDAHTYGTKDQVVQELFEISPTAMWQERNGKKPGAGGRRPGGSQRPKMLRGCGKPQCAVELLRREPNQGTTTRFFQRTWWPRGPNRLRQDVNSLTERLSRPEFLKIAAMATSLSARWEDDPVQTSRLKLGGSVSAEMRQGLRTDHSTAGGLRHRINLRGEATIQLRSRKEKWDVGIHLEQCG